MYGEALTAVRAFTGADSVELWLTEDGSLVRAGDAGSLAGEALAREAASSGSMIVEKARGQPSVCALPLWLRGGTVGVLVVTAPDDAASIGRDEQRVLEGIGHQIALGVENARLHEQVLDRAVLEERERIARELHDGLAQVLGFINTQSQAARKLLASGRVQEATSELEAMSAASRDVYDDVREAILGLRAPPKGLVATLRDFVERFPRAPSARLSFGCARARRASCSPPRQRSSWFGSSRRRSELPGWMQSVSAVLPFTHGIDAARRAASGASLGDVGGALLVELGIGAVYATIGYRMIRATEQLGRRHATLERA